MKSKLIHDRQLLCITDATHRFTLWAATLLNICLWSLTWTNHTNLW